MHRYVLALLAAIVAVSASAQDTRSADLPKLSAQQAAALRCSAAFGLVAEGQARGDEASLSYPALGERGKEFFVRSAARLMDELALDRAGIQTLVSLEAQKLWDEEGLLEDVMPSCLTLLDASGL